MWYRIGYFVPSDEQRRKGTHRINRWAMISGPHYNRAGSDRRKNMCETLADNLARQGGYILESVITVNEHDLPKYELVAFPWLLVQSTFWGKEAS